MKFILKTFLLILLSIFIADSINCQANHKIIDFRSNPLGFSANEGLYPVDLNINSNDRVLAYVDFNEDKL